MFFLLFSATQGSTYNIKIKFYAQHEIVVGLKYLNFVYKLGIRSCVPHVSLSVLSCSQCHDFLIVLLIANGVLFSRIHIYSVDKTEENIGSFAPKLEAYEHTFDEETAPEGWLARGNYTAKTKLVDDDGKVHLEVEYAIEIAKDF